MKVTESAVRHPVTTFMVFTALFVLGVISLFRLDLDLFPDITLPTVAVVTIYPGVGPYEVESAVNEPVEEAVSSLNGVDSVSSSASEGISFVIISFTWGTDIDTMVPEIREKLNLVESEFPEGVERPEIYKYNPDILPILRLNVFTETEGIDIRRLAEKEIVPELERIQGIAQAELYGGKQSAVLARIDLDALAKLEIPLTDVLRSFGSENISLPGGSITLGSRYMIMRTIGEFASLEDVGKVLVGYRGGVPIFLEDIAEVRLDYLPQEEFVRTATAEGVQIAVRKQPGYNTVDINRSAMETVRRLEQVLPPSVRVEVQSDQSTSIVQSIGGVADAAWQGGLLAIVVLLLFLRNIRSTLIISLVIPVSVIATFSLMDFGGLTVNITSLMGITLGIGMFVDNSIVVLESTYRKQLAGRDPVQSAVEGTGEVGRAIITSTLTTVAVFVPMLFVEGLAGLIFRDLAYTISYALTISLAVALTLIPLLCARFLRLHPATATKLNRQSGTPLTSREESSSYASSSVSEDPPDPENQDFQEFSLADVEIHSGNRFIDGTSRLLQKGLKRLDEYYETALHWSLRHSAVVVVSAVLLLALSVGSVLLLGMEFLPETDEAHFSISIETRVGSTFAYTEEKVNQIQGIIREVCGDEIESIAASIGSSGGGEGSANSGSNLGFVSVALTEKDRRSRSIWEILNSVEDRMNERILDIDYSIQIEGMASLATTATGETSPIVIEISGEDLEVMEEYASEVEDMLNSIPGARNIKNSHQTGKPEIQLKVLRREALTLGLTPMEIAATIRTAYNGSTVSRYQEGTEDYDVVLILNEQDRNDLDRLRNIFFVNPAGTKIPLENVVTIQEDTGPLTINRSDRSRIIKVSAALTGDLPLSEVLSRIEDGMEKIGDPPLGVRTAMSGTSREMTTSYRDLMYALILAIALVYMVMASQFESLLHPFIVMFSVPFAVIGLVGALLVTGTTFNIVAFIGAILLVGIVVNNAIVLIDYMNLLRKNGLPLKQAIIHGGKTRLKPILMTSLTTILGLLPMALGLGTGSELRAPMGRAVVGGLTTSTLITLILIPTLYWILESKLRRKPHEA